MLDLLKRDSFFVKEGEHHILHVLFPDHLIFLSQAPPFVFQQYLVVGRNDLKNSIPYMGEKDLNDRRWFLYLLEKLHRIKEKEKPFLESLDDPDFWIMAKQRYYISSVYKNVDKSNYNIFPLFLSLFGEFKKTCVNLSVLDIPYNILFSSLITMMTKCLDLDRITVSQGYRKVLTNHKHYLNLFRREVLEYLETKRTYDDFLSFLFHLSLEGRSK